jgi:hypothetical protein
MIDAKSFKSPAETLPQDTGEVAGPGSYGEASCVNS